MGQILGAEPIIELGPALQQAAAPTVLIVKKRKIINP
jgi:hypothetical protein